MATCKVNSEDFKELENSAKGVLLVYTSQDGKKTAQQFFGAEYEPVDKSQNEIFRVWKNVLITFWAVKKEELKLRESNDGIRSKFRASIPTEIIFHASNGDTKRFPLETSVWSRIGLVPTKKDFERTERDYKKAIHAAAKASFDALGFRVALPKEAEQPVEQPAESVVVNPVPQSAEVPVEVVAETTAETATEQVTAKGKGKGKGKGKNKATEQPIAEQPQEQPTEVTAEVITEQPTEQVMEQQPVAEMEVAA